MTYNPRKSGDEIAVGMLNHLESAGQFRTHYRYGGTYAAFKQKLEAARTASNPCAAVKGVRAWIRQRNRVDRLEVEGKLGQAMQELGAAEREHCGG